MKLSLSKIGDGICDCCDGADEANVKCPDNCAAVLAEARRRRQALQDAYTAGAKQRQADLRAFADFVLESKAAVTAKEAERVVVQTTLDETNTALQAAKRKWIQARLERYHKRIQALFTQQQHQQPPWPDLRDLLHPLTTAELSALVVHACQMAGEMPDAAAHKTCVPLRLAGLAVGVVWEPQTYQWGRVGDNNDDDNEWVALANLVYANVQDPAHPKWHHSHLSNNNNNNNQAKHRRLDEIYDGYMDAYDEYDDDDDDEDLLYGRPPTKESSGRPQAEEEDSSQRDAQTTWVKEQPFSVPRTRFLTITDALLKKIDEYTRQTEDAEQGRGENETATTPEPPAGFDPLAAPLIRNQITRTQESIHRGFTYAVSARVLLQNVQDRDLLQALFFGVWYYGQLSAWQMWQVYQSVVPELGGTVDGNYQSCQVVWGCPPVAATRKIGKENVMMPPAFFVQVVDEYCRAASMMMDMDAELVCSPDQDSIPGAITDGMYGYYNTAPRADDDAASVLFEGLGLDNDLGEEYKLDELLTASENLENQVSDLQDEIAKIKKDLGENEDGSYKYGKEGELFKQKDTCLEIKEGKYTYELCLFGSAKQKEGQSRGGTDLGRWSEASVTEDGQRVWSWENGAKCWNGPKRSAWAYLTCGATTKIISADEPETCKYVFQVESYIACDEDYRIAHELS